MTFAILPLLNYKLYEHMEWKKVSKMEEKWIKHYSSHHKILLVGEGDFSFTLSLANAFGSASNIVATSRDSKESLETKYSRASTILDELESLGCTILHEVDAHYTHNHPFLQHKFFDRVVYNFPHAGFLLPETNLYQIELHQEVVFGFLKSARMMVTSNGEVHVTHKNNHPFCKWEIVKLAEKASLLLVETVSFEISEYPGYVNKRGSGSNTDGSFAIGDSNTFKFAKPKIVGVGSPVLGLSLLLMHPDPLQLINHVSKINLLNKKHKGLNLRVDSKMEEKWIKHYSSGHKILLVGEGDFSFALCLAKAFGSASNIVATSLDLKGSLLLNYPVEILQRLWQLEDLGCTILHGVDVHSMYAHPLLQAEFFDRIVFNFPQDASFPYPEDKPYGIGHHKKLVLGFLHSARKMLSQNGEIHVTLKSDFPFCKWGVVKLAEEAGLVLVKKAKFKRSDYPNYVNRRGSGDYLTWKQTFLVGYCSTFKFSKSRDVKSLVLEISEIPKDLNSMQPKDSVTELNENEVVDVLTSTTSIHSSPNTKENSNPMSRCTIL